MSNIINFFLKQYSKLFFKNNELQLFIKLVITGLYLVISTCIFYVVAVNFFHINSYWSEMFFANISRFAFILISINYIYIVMAYSMIFYKVVVEARNAFDRKKDIEF